MTTTKRFPRRVATATGLVLLMALAPIRGSGPLRCLPPSEALAQAAPRLAESRRLASEAIAAYRAGDHARFEAKADSALSLRPDHPNFVYNLAAARALRADTAGAVRLLTRIADWGLSYDPASDPDFEALAGAPGFDAARARLLANGRPAGDAARAVVLDDPETLPEGLAHDPVTGALYLGSVRRRAILHVAPDGSSSVFVDGAPDGMPAPLGLALDPERRILWVSGTRVPESDPELEAPEGAAPDRAAATQSEAQVRAYDLESGRLLRTLVPPASREADAAPSAAGDIALAPSGAVLVSDWRTGALLRSTPGSDTLEAVLPPGSLGSPQGIVPAEDGRSAWVADYSLGLARVDLVDGAVRIVRPPGTTLLGSDALLAHEDGLIVVQNGVSPARILRLELSRDGTEVTGWTPLLAAHPDFAEPTGAASAGNSLLVVANGQWARFAGGEVKRSDAPTPPIILRLDPDVD